MEKTEMENEKEKQQMALIIKDCNWNEEHKDQYELQNAAIAQRLQDYGYGNVKKAIEEFSKQVQQIICDCTVPDFNKDGKPISRFKVDGYKQIDALKKKFCDR